MGRRSRAALAMMTRTRRLRRTRCACAQSKTRPLRGIAHLLRAQAGAAVAPTLFDIYYCDVCDSNFTAERDFRDHLVCFRASTHTHARACTHKTPHCARAAQQSADHKNREAGKRGASGVAARPAGTAAPSQAQAQAKPQQQQQQQAQKGQQKPQEQQGDASNGTDGEKKKTRRSGRKRHKFACALCGEEFSGSVPPAARRQHGPPH